MAESKQTIQRLLIANRGEIALRVIRAAKAMGIHTIAAYSDVDEGTLPMRSADEAVALGGSHARDTYLNIDKLISAAIQTRADAIHPGYGFLAENANFARAVSTAGLVFVGPRAETIQLMGDKQQARKLVQKFNVPVVPGIEVSDKMETVRSFGTKVGYPIMFKAVAGGSGRGMRLVASAEELEGKAQEAASEAKAAFGNEALIVEKVVMRPRHIEVQVFGDRFGNYLHFGERECSVQRRHQKLIEEAPAPKLNPILREKILRAALNVCKAAHYENAGTVEFIVERGESENDPFYFLEMNTRIQVEHPVTEVVYGYDLLQLQLRIAEGEKLGVSQEAIRARGHAIEFRVYAEDPRQDFKPTNGDIIYISRAGGAGVREDSWVEAGTRISAFYDSLIAKLIVWGRTRAEALGRATALLDEYSVEGFETTLDFHRWLLRSPAFLDGTIDVQWIGREYKGETLAAMVVGPLELPVRKKQAKV